MQEKPFSLITAVLFALTGFILTTSVSRFAQAEAVSVECFECQKNDDQIKARVAKKERTSEILRKNQEYLQKKPGAPKSVAIKIKSNVMITMLQIETVDNELVALRNKSETQRCAQCPK